MLGNEIPVTPSWVIKLRPYHRLADSSLGHIGQAHAEML